MVLSRWGSSRVLLSQVLRPKTKERRDRDRSCSPRQGASETAWPDAPLAGARVQDCLRICKSLTGSSWRFLQEAVLDASRVIQIVFIAHVGLYLLSGHWNLSTGSNEPLGRRQSLTGRQSGSLEIGNQAAPPHGGRSLLPTWLSFPNPTSMVLHRRRGRPPTIGPIFR
jgi:hypothetical protein